MTDKPRVIRGSIQDTLIVANLLMKHGLKPNRKLLEISEYSTGKDSLSMVLGGQMQSSFLLSRNYDYEEAMELGIDGARGQLDNLFKNYTDIRAEKSSLDPFFDPFDTVVVEGFSSDLLLLPGLSQDVFAGYSINVGHKALPRLRYMYESLYEILNFKDKGYVRINEQYKRPRKEYFLILKQ